MVPMWQGLLGVCVRAIRGHTPPRLWGRELVVTHLSTAACRSAPEQQDTAVKQQDQQDEGTKHENTETLELPTVLQAATAKNSYINAFKGLHTLSDMVSSKQVDFKKDVEGDEQFEKMIAVIDQSVIRCSPTTSLGALRSLLNLGVDSNSHVVQSVQMQLLWQLRKMSFPSLISVLTLHIDHQHTDLQKRVLKECIESIERRWVEMRGAGEMEKLYTCHTHFSSEFLGRLDDRVMELADTMTYPQLAKLLCALGTIKRRATPVIRALAFHMAKQTDRLSPKQLGNVLFAVNLLSFPDPVLLEKIASDLMPQVEEINNPKLVGSILFCLGHMRWRHPGLLEVLSEWTEKRASDCPLANLSALVLTLASAGYEPSNGDTLFPLITSRLNPSSFTKKTAWLDVVWSLTVLGRVSSEQIESVLHPSFVSSIPLIEQHLRLGVRLKLLNINAAAQLLLHSYSGPQLNLAEFKDVIITAGQDERKVSQHVMKMLHNLLPPPKYIYEGIQTSIGVYVDAEFATDKNGKPLPVQDFGEGLMSKSGEYVGTKSSGSTVTKKLPEGVNRVALFVWNYSDFAVGSQELTGINKLGVELLRKKGYKLVQIPYFEYNMKGKALRNVQYLEGKIKESLVV
ncbi:hypothetical protein Pcinc_019982 [Petrolisthes cinctipes]|uniref:RAP domain-containing protein n=1 Tax=Petrolisthes cinctipes TaxID=88211 RepID=A0AAE1FJ26_PETCI|nr:hypothetical protein Pcinc_019982 [Petrolisthes cinctipes]